MKNESEIPEFNSERDYLNWLLGYNGADEVLRAPATLRMEPNR